MTLTGINEDNYTSAGNTIAALIATGSGDRITDVDAAAIEGIAVIAVDNTNGAWQYNTGSGWNNFGTPTASAARLLGADTANNKIRFVPNLNFTGTVDPGITFRAWDKATGSNGSTADISSGGARGGTTAYSTATETAAIAVAAINDKPVLDNIESTHIAYQRADPATAITATLTASDVDDINLAAR